MRDALHRPTNNRDDRPADNRPHRQDGDIPPSELADLRDRWYRAEARSDDRVLADLRWREGFTE